MGGCGRSKLIYYHTGHRVFDFSQPLLLQSKILDILSRVQWLPHGSHACCMRYEVYINTQSTLLMIRQLLNFSYLINKSYSLWLSHALPHLRTLRGCVFFTEVGRYITKLPKGWYLAHCGESGLRWIAVFTHQVRMMAMFSGSCV